MRVRTVDVGGIGLAVAERGAGERRALVVHGFTGAKEDLAPTQAFLARRGLHVAAPDLRGHGASDAPRSASAYDFDLMAADLVAVADHLGWERFLLVGHSLGGALAQLVALHHPDRVDGLVLVSSFHGPLHGLEPALLALGSSIVRQSGMAGLARAMDDHRRSDPAASAAAARLEGSWPGHQEHHRRTVEASSADMWLSVAPRFHSQEDRLARLAGLDVPTLVVVGSEDRMMIEDCRRLAATVPAARLVVVPGAGHNPHLEAEGVWQRALSEFLDSLGPPPPRRRPPPPTS